MQIKVKKFNSEVFKNKSGDFIFCLNNSKNYSHKIIKRETIFDLMLETSNDFVSKPDEEFFEINEEEKKAIEIFLLKKMNLIRADLRVLLKLMKELKEEELEEKRKEKQL